MNSAIKKAIKSCYRYGTIDFELCAKDTCPLYEDCNNLYYQRKENNNQNNTSSDFYKEIVNKTKQANDPDKLEEEFYNAIKIRIEDAAEEGVDNCYVEANWRYDFQCLRNCINKLVDEGFTCRLNHNHQGYSIHWEGGTGAYDEEREVMRQRYEVE